MAQVAGRRSHARSDRHRQSAGRRQSVFVIFAGLAMLAVATALILMLTSPVGVAWPSAHVLQTAALQVPALWDQAAADATAMGEADLILSDNHVAAWLNRLVDADVADPRLAVASLAGTVTLYYRMRLAFDLRPVVSLRLRPSLLEDAVLCTVEGAWIGRCPVPAALWQSLLVRGDRSTAPGWIDTDGALGYAWPIQLAAPAGTVIIRDIAATPGQLALTLTGPR